MSTDDMKDDEFDAYLSGRSPLSDAYGSLAQQEPAEESDLHIRAAAREAIDKHPKVASSPFSSNWAVPVSIAAVLVVAVSIIALLPELEKENQIPLASNGLHPEHETLAKSPQRRTTPSASRAVKPGVAGKQSMATDETAITQAPAEKARTDSVIKESQPSKASIDRSRARQQELLQAESKQKVEGTSRLTEERKTQGGMLRENQVAPIVSGAALRPAPSDWLNHIRHLRTTGNLKDANITMDQFIDFYFGKAPYPHTDMLSLLDNEDRQHFLDELDALKRTEEKQVLEKLLRDNPYPEK